MDFSYPLMDLKNTFLKLCARCTLVLLCLEEEARVGAVGQLAAENAPRELSVIIFFSEATEERRNPYG